MALHTNVGNIKVEVCERVLRTCENCGLFIPVITIIAFRVLEVPRVSWFKQEIPSGPGRGSDIILGGRANSV